ncbi:MAG TPA: fumarylacetoacetase [Candidatus Dormibacteraeota bacterium]|nr:fumarylacetoacetase [Candidatus Dormibacteraeota bacterium]
MQSWRDIGERSDFPLENLPYGAFRTHGGAIHLGVAIGEEVLDLAAVAEAGLIDDICERELLEAGSLNPFLAAGRECWTSVRERLIALLQRDGDARLRTANADRFFARQRDIEMVLPVEIGDYVDFYSSIEHATNLGRMFRPDGDALMPNWRHLPIGYHGRASTIVIDGTPIVRPSGQRKPPQAALPAFGPSTRLDIELEVGFITGPGNAMGEPIAIADAREHIFGVVLVNDWSARDIQAWEYQPLGPFLGKSFATTISPWIVTLDALEPFRTAGPLQVPQPLEYLQTREEWAYDIALAVDVQSRTMRERGIAPQTISRTTFAAMYWNIAQQLAHATSNGTAIRPGDLYASGTISGPTPDSLGSLIELTWNGERPIELASGERRAFLEDGDEVTLRGWCERGGASRIGFGAARGTILPAR